MNSCSQRPGTQNLSKGLSGRFIGSSPLLVLHRSPVSQLPPQRAEEASVLLPSRQVHELCFLLAAWGGRPCSKLVPAEDIPGYLSHYTATILLTTSALMIPVSKVLCPAGTAMCILGNYLRTSWNLQVQSEVLRKADCSRKLGNHQMLPCVEGSTCSALKDTQLHHSALAN